MNVPQLGQFDGVEVLAELGNGDIPDEAGVRLAQLHVGGDLRHGSLEGSRLLLENIPLVELAEDIACQLGDCGAVGVGLYASDILPQQIGQRVDLFRIALPDGHNDVHSGNRNLFIDEPLGPGHVDVADVGGDVEVAAAGDLHIAQQCLGAAV